MRLPRAAQAAAASHPRHPLNTATTSGLGSSSHHYSGPFPIHTYTLQSSIELTIHPAFATNMKLLSLPWQPRREDSGYTTVRSDDTDCEALESRRRSPEKTRYHNAPSNTSTARASKIWQVSLILLVITGGFIGGYALSAFRISTSSSHTTLHPRCQNPTVRQEWRSLSTQEKDAYLDAVSCLKTKPSRLGLNHTLYDDFPWVHIHKGTYSESSHVRSTI